MFTFIWISLVCSYAIYRIILYPLYLSPLRHIPGPPLFPLPPSRTWNPLSYLLAPIFGQFPAIINGEAGIPQRAWFKQYGPIVRVVGPVGIERVMFLSPEACDKILIKDWAEYPLPNFGKICLGFVLGHGLFTAEKNEHRQMRRTMNAAFSLPNLTSQIDKYYNAIHSLLRILTSEIISAKEPSKGVILPIHEWMSKVTLDIICSTAFSYDSNSLNDPQNVLAASYERMSAYQSGRNFAWSIAFVSIPGFIKFMGSKIAWRLRWGIGLIPDFGRPMSIIIDSMYTIRQVSREILKQNLTDELRTTKTEHERKKDIMSLLIRARKGDSESEPMGYRLSDEAIMDQVLTFLAAGHETTAAALDWTLFLLAANKQVQDTLREEVTPILSADPEPEYQRLKELQWLDSVVLESLRVLPVVPMSFRQAAKTDFIDGVFIPEGTILYIPIRVINTWKATWGPDAEEFRPERWLNLPTTYHSHYPFMSFFLGPHTCMGKMMAMIQMKTILASLIANFEFDLAFEGQLPKPTAAITMKPNDGMPLRIRRVERR